MANSKDTVRVSGNFITRSSRWTKSSWSTGDNYFHAGKMYIGGDLYQYGEGNFICENNHTVIFTGDKTHLVSFENPYSHLNFIDFEDNAKIKFLTDISPFRLFEDFVIEGDLVLINDDGGRNYEFDLNGHCLTINGNLRQENCAIIINNGVLDIHGDYRIQKAKIDNTGEILYSECEGNLQMTNSKDRINVDGDFIIQTSQYSSGFFSSYNTFSAGEITIGGDFYQYNYRKGNGSDPFTDTYGDNFVCDNTHKVKFVGNNHHKIFFESSSAYWNYCRFNILEITGNKNNYTFSYEPCWNKLIEPEVHTHSYTSKVTKAATCKEEGIKTYTCKCGKSYTESIAKLTTHTFGDWTNTKAATCSSEGTQTRKCSVCGKAETQSIAKLTTHTFSNWTTTKSATCAVEGSQTRKCSVCGKEESKSVAKTAHKYTAKVVKPTYTAQGYTLHTCSVCGDSYKDNIKAKLTRTSIAKATVSGLKSKYYTGKSITQTPVVKLSSKTLKAGTDYTVSYKSNKAVGTATVTITGKGAYTGTVKATFKINPKKTTLKSVTSPKTKQLKVTYSKVSGVTGYQISYSTSSKFTAKTTKATKSTATSKTINKLTKGKTYYVRVRTYKTVGGTKYYSGWSAVKKIKLK